MTVSALSSAEKAPAVDVCPTPRVLRQDCTWYKYTSQDSYAHLYSVIFQCGKKYVLVNRLECIKFLSIM